MEWTWENIDVGVSKNVASGLAKYESIFSSVITTQDLLASLVIPWVTGDRETVKNLIKYYVYYCIYT